MQKTELGLKSRATLAALCLVILTSSMWVSTYALKKYQSNKNRTNHTREVHKAEVLRLELEAEIQELRRDKQLMSEPASLRLSGYIHPAPFRLADYDLHKEINFPKEDTLVYDSEHTFIGVYQTDGGFISVLTDPDLYSKYVGYPIGEVQEEN